jgi:hypothetical protein
MKYLLGMLGVVGVLLSGPLAAQTALTNTTGGPTAADRAKLGNHPAVVEEQLPLVDPTHAETAVACSQCWTCGGDWPVFAGSHTVVAAPGNVTERGPGCSGAPGAITQDQRPYLCCR